MSVVSTMVWNRACYGGGEKPRQGDKHLAALLHFHGPAMNGGVLHAVQFCSHAQLRDAKAGYVYLGLEKAVSVIAKAEAVLRNEDDPGDFERELDAEYYAAASDAHLSAQFMEKFEREPHDFAPVQ
jgi:hypothetical protein